MIIRRARTASVTVAVAALFLGVGTLDTGSAAPVALTSNPANAITARTIDPPTDVAATLGLNVLPLLTCNATITWTPSTLPDIDGYEVRRVTEGTGAVAGPWTSAGPPYVDGAAPVIAGLYGYEWQVRSVVSSGWKSEWVTAVVDNALLCLL